MHTPLKIALALAGLAVSSAAGVAVSTIPAHATMVGQSNLLKESRESQERLQKHHMTTGRAATTAAPVHKKVHTGRAATKAPLKKEPVKKAPIKKQEYGTY